MSELAWSPWGRSSLYLLTRIENLLFTKVGECVTTVVLILYKWSLKCTSALWPLACYLMYSRYLFCFVHKQLLNHLSTAICFLENSKSLPLHVSTTFSFFFLDSKYTYVRYFPHISLVSDACLCIFHLFVSWHLGLNTWMLSSYQFANSLNLF